MLAYELGLARGVVGLARGMVGLAPGVVGLARGVVWWGCAEIGRASCRERVSSPV